MKEINVSKITLIVRQLCIDANIHVSRELLDVLREFLEKEESPTAREILTLILENHAAAKREKMPMCQDTGTAIVFIELGQDVHLVGGDFNAAIQEGVRQGYCDGYLRKSIVDDAVFTRINTNDNTPALIYTEIVPGDRIKITVTAKGAGAENMSEVRMLKPADGIEVIKDFVVEKVRRSGGNPCPPVVVGVGIGGDFEQCALLAKKALLRPLKNRHPNPKWAQVEAELLERINRLGIGPQGLGGRTTALAVKILEVPCHIASMPVAVNLNCHVSRYKSAIIE